MIGCFHLHAPLLRAYSIYNNSMVMSRLFAKGKILLQTIVLSQSVNGDNLWLLPPAGLELLLLRILRDCLSLTVLLLLCFATGRRITYTKSYYCVLIWLFASSSKKPQTRRRRSRTALTCGSACKHHTTL